ncbi:MAG: thiazole synthase [Bacillota bacterium]
MEDQLKIGNREFSSRLLTGTGKFPSQDLITETIEAAQSEIVTMALRRVNFDNPQENVVNQIPDYCTLLPNTSGARSAEEAVRIARIAREAGCGKWVKIEVIKDNKYLMPDNWETIKATEILAEEGFVVLPYVSPDLVVAKELEAAGAATVMPLGAPIGSNQGLQTKELIKILIEQIEVPIVVDAGIGKPSQAAAAMELGADAVLVNTAIATAQNPVQMGRAFAQAVKAGRSAYLAGTGRVQQQGSASSPLTGFLGGE